MKTAYLQNTLSILAIASVSLFFIFAKQGRADWGNQPSRYDLNHDPKALLAPVSKVDYNAYEKLVAEVKEHRKSRLVRIEEFQKLSKGKHTIILDTRSDAMYKAKHVKGAIHLNFSDFTQDNLARVIPAYTDTILIYCNNNFNDDETNFASKSVKPTILNPIGLTLALNIPTYINLYGYGYKNVYELGELISAFDERIQFEGKLD